MNRAEEALNFNQHNRDQWVVAIAEKLPADTRILDLGAGGGRYRALFKHCDYKAQDFGQYKGSGEGVLKERWYYEELDYVCDASSIPVPNNSFDAVLCTEVLEHVPEPIKVLKEIGRIVTKNGRAFISAPLGSGLHQQPYHFYGGFTPHFYKRFLEEFGFEVVSIDPNRRFFAMLSQEIRRGISIVQAHQRYPTWHPVSWLLRVASGDYVAKWLMRLDVEIPIDEFTVGFHVEAIKKE
jgi:ubiquinone/menaquinone biosynthesis C-methylase UbiE